MLIEKQGTFLFSAQVTSEDLEVHIFKIGTQINTDLP